jgi:hypothetical protein
VQDVAYFVDQLRFETPPGSTEVGLAVKYETRGLQLVQELVSAATTGCANTNSAATAASVSANSLIPVVIDRARTVTFPVCKARHEMRAPVLYAVSLKAGAARRQLKKYRRN